MRVAPYPHRGGVGFNMTPMIDVVFLLIIFFLVSSHMARQESQRPVDLPAASQGREDRLDDDRPRVVVNVDPQGDVLLSGRVVAPQELQRRIEYERRQLGESLEVRIRADRRVAYRHVEPILLACARGGVWNVTFKVIQKEH